MGDLPSVKGKAEGMAHRKMPDRVRYDNLQTSKSNYERPCTTLSTSSIFTERSLDTPSSPMVTP